MTPGGATVSAYLRMLRGRLDARTTEGPEAQLADLLPDLIRSLAPQAGRPGVDLLQQAYEVDVGRPDFSVKAERLLIGHVETKAPGAGADPEALRSAHDRRQWQRFRNLPNLLYTDGTSFGLYRSGRREGDIVHLSLLPAGGDGEAPSEEINRLLALLGAFLSWRAIAPRNLPALAEQLAPLCAVLRDAVRSRLEDPSSEVAKASAEFEEALFSGRTMDEIADAFAQVCAYSMLLARSGGAPNLDAAAVEAVLAHGHPVLARVVRVLLDDQTERELGWALETIRALLEVVDFDRLRGRLLPGSTHHDQTWLYFYETFLARYDPRLRDQYGVYYTPQQVIQAQVGLVEDVLRSRLGMPLGFASPDVTVLDPAVGTGSYPLRVVLAAADSASRTLGEAAVPGVVGALAANLHAFEILVGPYAVAHLRISEAIEDMGARVPDEGVSVLLTDTLASPFTEPASLTRLLDPLVEEQRRALKVKSGTSILVCIGNPPYERGRRMEDSGEVGGGWVVSGDGPGAPAPLEDFLRPLREEGLGGHAKNLYNDYVYFWRWSLWKAFESQHGGAHGPGVVSLITASSYLGGEAFAGMREHMRRTCDEIWILDLGGEGRGARREENVFAIQTPVAIAVAIRQGAAQPDAPAAVRYARLTGSRSDKLQALDGIDGLDGIEWSECRTEWAAPFFPRAEAGWTEMPAVAEVFPWQSPGLQAHRTWPIGPTPQALEQRWSALLTSPDREAALHRTRDRNVTSVVPPLSGDLGADAIERLPADAPPPPIVRFGFRPFDRQWLIADSRVIDYPRPKLWRTASERQIFMVAFLTQVLGSGPAAVVSSAIPDYHHFRGSFGGRHVIPLYGADGEPNVDPQTVARFGTALGQAVEPEALFAYAYGVLSTPRYTERFFDELRQPGPRLPITGDPDAFHEMTALGARLLWLHTFGQRLTGPDRPRGVAAGRARVTHAIPDDPERFPAEFHYDDERQELRVGLGTVAPVAAPVWEYEVSGYRVVHRWLSYRMRDGAGRARGSSSPLDAIRPIAWPARYTTELLELLWVLEATTDLAPEHAYLLDRICDGPLIS